MHYFAFILMSKLAQQFEFYLKAHAGTGFALLTCKYSDQEKADG